MDAISGEKTSNHGEVLSRARGKHLVVYDGVCGLCNGFIKFIIHYDKKREFFFTPLQSEIGQSVLARHGLDARELNTVYLVCDVGENESVLSKSQAAFFIMQKLGSIFQVIALGRLLGVGVGNFFYDLVAANRYKVFGKSDACMIPTPDVRERFLDM